MMPTLAWLHDLSPFLVRISGDFGVRWYGLAYAAGFVLGWLWLTQMSRLKMTPISTFRIADAMLLLVMGVVVGGRLGYVLVYQPSLLIAFTGDFPFWGVLRLNQGGMSSHGGIVGVVVASWFIARGPKDAAGGRPERVPWLHVLDITAVASTVGLGLGRVANFINGELLGKIVANPGEKAPWWAVKFPQEWLEEKHTPVVTAEQYEALNSLTARYARQGDEFEDAYRRVLDALQGGGSRAAEVATKLEPLVSARHPSQIYQAVTDGLVLALSLWLIWAKPRKPGVIGCWFMMMYGVLRIITEFYRLPDANLAVERFMGLSRGQWLSVLMVLVGAVALPLCLRQRVEPMGGWMRKKTA